jgi:nitroreductase
MNVKEAINARFSQRYYDTTKKINEDDLKTILTAGIKAPNGFGLEAWKFLAIDGDKSSLKPLCWNQQFIEDCSHVIALLNYKQEFIDANPSVAHDKILANGFSKDDLEKYKPMLSSLGTQYYREQIMFAASQMVLQATSIGIGSVVVGGFLPDEVAKLLKVDTTKFEVGLLIAVGYSLNNEPKVRVNRPYEEVVQKITL